MRPCKVCALGPISLPLALAIAALALSPVAYARDWFATPVGGGKKDASAWDNAAGTDGLQALLDRLQPGDRLLLGGGEYRDARLLVRASGTREKPITVMGIDRGAGLPVFVSTWKIEAPKKGATAVALAAGVSHVMLRDVAIRGYQHGVQAAAPRDGQPKREGCHFENVDMERIRHGFYLSGFAGLRLAGCDLRRYAKHGFRFDADCSQVVLERCTADCSEGDAAWENQTEEFPFGFIVNDAGAPNRGFVFEDCASRNNMMPLQKARYKNGDGFVVEGNSEDVVFRRCRALRNQDGGFDLKVRDVRLEDCVAIRNKRDFRIWKTGRLVNCLAGWSQAGLWTEGGPVVAERCTIAGWRSAPVQTEDAKAGVELRACLIAADGVAKMDSAHMKLVTLVDCVKTAALDAAGLQRPPEDWDGRGTAADSATHSEVGYRSTR